MTDKLTVARLLWSYMQSKGCSLGDVAKRLGWSVAKVHGFLKILERKDD